MKDLRLAIMSALNEVDSLPSERDTSLVRTKLQEALLWTTFSSIGFNEEGEIIVPDIIEF